MYIYKVYLDSRINEKSRIYGLYLTLKIEFHLLNNSLLLVYVEQTIVEQKNIFLGWDKGNIYGTFHLSYFTKKIISWYFPYFAKSVSHLEFSCSRTSHGYFVLGPVKKLALRDHRSEKDFQACLQLKFNVFLFLLLDNL